MPLCNSPEREKLRPAYEQERSEVMKNKADDIAEKLQLRLAVR